jgi:hypothetical protein
VTKTDATVLDATTLASYDDAREDVLAALYAPDRRQSLFLP